MPVNNSNETVAWIAFFGTAVTAVATLVGGKAYQVRQANLARITAAEASAAEAREQCDQIRKEMAAYQLNITQNHATNGFVKEVELRMTRQIEVLHKDVIAALRGK